jgi:signal transduction histidine kinase
MAQADAPPEPTGDRESLYSRLLLLPAAVMSVATGIAVAVVAGPARIPVAWCGALATLVVALCAVELARRARITRSMRTAYEQRLSFLEQRIVAQDRQAVLVAQDLVPSAVRYLKSGHSPQETMARFVDGNERYRRLPDPYRMVLKTVLRICDDEEATRDAAQAAFINVARRVQAIVHQQHSELREMEEDHGRNPEVFDDLLRIDHGTSLIGRLADSVSYLGGGRPSRQWPKPVPLYSVLRGAMSRILEYRRIELHQIAKVAVIGTAVEPVIHACAELLDNSTRYSPPQTKVHVTAVEVQTGVAIEIEDGGVCLTDEARYRAERMLALAKAGGGLRDLGDTPRLGLAVVGRICREYDLEISLRESAYGGVRVVVIVPSKVLTTGPAPGLAHGIGATAQPRFDEHGNPIQEVRTFGLPRPPRKPRPQTGPRRSEQTPLTSYADDEDEIVVTEWTANGLPQRRSNGRAPLFSHNLPENRTGGGDWNRSGGRLRPGATAPEPEPAPGLWIGDFTRAVKDAPQGPPQSPGHETGWTDATGWTDRTDQTARIDHAAETRDKGELT